MSKTYKVTYTENLVYDFYVDAENEAEAEEKFKQGLEEGAFDFSDGHIASSDYEIREV